MGAAGGSGGRAVACGGGGGGAGPGTTASLRARGKMDRSDLRLAGQLVCAGRDAMEENSILGTRRFWRVALAGHWLGAVAM